MCPRGAAVPSCRHQALTGLFATDDISTEGPLRRHVEDDVAATMNWIHHRVFWIVLALIGTHLAVHVTYAAFKDANAPFDDYGPQGHDAPATGQYLLHGAITLGLALALIYGASLVV